MERKRRNKPEEKDVSSVELTKRVLIYLYNRKRNQKANQELENQKGILPLVQTVIEYFKTVDPKTWLKLTVGMGFCIFSLITYWNLKQKLKQMSNPLRPTLRSRFVEDLNSPLMSLEQWNELRRCESDEDNIFDVCIIGAGPSGGTCAFYLAKGGKRVLLLDKSHFPRDKVCGNTINTTAQYHLKEMGVLQEILSEIGLSKWAYNGGLVSPSGDSFVGDFTSSRMIHIKRSILDEKIAVAAARQGATFRDNTNVEYVKFNDIKGLWDIHSSKCVYKAKVLVAADGAESRIARQLGYVKNEPDSVGGTAYSEENVHGLQAGHVIFYTKDLLPGHIVMANEANKTLNLSCFVYSETDPRKVNQLFQDVAQKDELVSRSLGPDALLSPFQTAPLRIKTIEKPYGDHFLIVGEAAGHVDALTGEGIQYGMDAGKIAAQVLLEALYIDDLSETRLKSYHEQWKQKYDWDFYFSTKLTEIIKKHPIVMDATVAVIRRRGADFVTSWALVSTGVKSKVWFARPDVGWMIALEAFSIWLQKICKSYIY